MHREIRRSLKDVKAFKEDKNILVKESRSINLAHFGPSFIDTVEWLSKIFS